MVALDKLFKFEGDGGYSKAWSRPNGLIGFETLTPCGAGEAGYSDHIVSITYDDVTASANWHGLKFNKAKAPAGTVIFLPGGSSLEGIAECEFRQTSMVLNVSEAETVVADLVNVDPNRLQYSIVSDPVAIQLARTMATVAASDGHNDCRLLAQSVSASLMTAIVGPSLVYREFGGLDKGRERRVAEFIAANIHRQIGLDELAEVASMSKFHFARRFRSTFGKSPHQYVSHLRVNETKRLLKNGALPLSEVAIACGYASQSHMNTVFRKLVGVSPGQYRRCAST